MTVIVQGLDSFNYGSDTRIRTQSPEIWPLEAWWRWRDSHPHRRFLVGALLAERHPRCAVAA